MVGRAVGRADRRPLRAQAAADRQPDDLRRGLAAERVRRPSLGMLTILRFFTGLGIGGGFSGRGRADRRLHAAAPARADDHGQLYRRADRRVSRRPGRRACAAADVSAGRVDLYRSAASSRWCWWSVMALWLPEVAALPRREGQSVAARQAALLQRLDIAPGQAAAMCSTSPRGNPIKMLFGHGLCAADRADVGDLLLQPDESVPVHLLDAEVLAPDRLDTGRRRSSPRASANCGAIFAVLYLGLLIDRFGPERSLALHYAAGIVFIALIALVAMPYLLLLVVIFFVGHDDHRQPDRRQRGVRQALSGADAHQRPRLGARHRAARRHRGAGAGRLSAVAAV